MARVLQGWRTVDFVYRGRCVAIGVVFRSAAASIFAGLPFQAVVTAKDGDFYALKNASYISSRAFARFALSSALGELVLLEEDSPRSSGVAGPVSLNVVSLCERVWSLVRS